MQWILFMFGFVILLAVLANISKLSQTGRKKWSNKKRTGESMLDDFDEEWKNIDKLSK